jgi:hypothetical protein
MRSLISFTRHRLMLRPRQAAAVARFIASVWRSRVCWAAAGILAGDLLGISLIAGALVIAAGFAVWIYMAGLLFDPAESAPTLHPPIVKVGQGDYEREW